MGLLSTTSIFQCRMMLLFSDMAMVIIYLDDILILVGTRSYEDHKQDVVEVIKRLQHKEMQINPRKYKFIKESFEYFGFMINHNGIKPKPKKVQKSLAIKRPTSKKQLRKIINIVKNEIGMGVTKG